eukprot:Clim_evm14s171 gene=Clim_evmTU14s171
MTEVYKSFCLNSGELETAANVLFDKGATLEQKKARFLETFPHHEVFRVLCSISILLEQIDLLPEVADRITVLYILYTVYEEKPVEHNPFLPLFVAVLSDPATADTDGAPPLNHLILTERERAFLATMIFASNNGQLKEMKAVDVAQSFSQRDVCNKALSQVDLTKLEQVVQEKYDETSRGLSAPNEPAVLRDSDGKAPQQSGPAHKAATNALLVDHGVTLPYSRLALPVVHLPPPLHTVSDDELQWITPQVTSYELRWDDGACIDDQKISEYRKIMSRAMQQSLGIEEAKAIMGALQKDRQLVFQLGIKPSKLPSLVDSNPDVAIEVLLSLMNTPHITEYLSVLVEMPLSLHSMEVVNRLTTTVELPKEFLQFYITNCISTCFNIKDKYQQARLVRLLCVFLQSLIRNKIIDVQEITIEVQAFCIEFSRIKEAAVLFHLLKNLDNGQAPAGQK